MDCLDLNLAEKHLNVLMMLALVYLSVILTVTAYQVVGLALFEIRIWKCNREFRARDLKREQLNEVKSIKLDKVLDGHDDVISLELDRYGVLNLSELKPKDLNKFKTFLESLK